jgi:galactose mutarotase-like enzyme
MASAAHGILQLRTDGATARIARLGAEPVSWRVDGRELIWSGDPIHWGRHAPILFPVVGASATGIVRVGPQSYAMPQHGFARDSLFTVVEQGQDFARLKLVESDETWKHFPFRFILEVGITLRPDSLDLVFHVTNADTGDMPYALGFHPAFPWPFDAGGPEGHAVEFDSEEDPQIPGISPEGLLREHGRQLSFDGRRLPLDPDLFSEALVFLDAKSRSMRFQSPTGARIELDAEDFPHLALWTRPAAPFLSMEAWTGHADCEGFAGDLVERPSMHHLEAGHEARHALTLRWHPG